MQAELKKRDWSQADLARKSGVSRAVISKIIGKSSRPQPETLQAIARGLMLPAYMVIQEAGVLPPHVQWGRVDEVNYLLGSMSPDEQDDVIDYIRYKIDHHDREKIEQHGTQIDLSGGMGKH